MKTCGWCGDDADGVGSGPATWLDSIDEWRCAPCRDHPYMTRSEALAALRGVRMAGDLTLDVAGVLKELAEAYRRRAVSRRESFTAPSQVGGRDANVIAYQRIRALHRAILGGANAP